MTAIETLIDKGYAITATIRKGRVYMSLQEWKPGYAVVADEDTFDAAINSAAEGILKKMAENKIPETTTAEHLLARQTVNEAAVLVDGVPCGHKGCERHISHPCEGCGRIGANKNA